MIQTWETNGFGPPSSRTIKTLFCSKTSGILAVEKVWNRLRLDFCHDLKLGFFQCLSGLNANGQKEGLITRNHREYPGINSLNNGNPKHSNSNHIFRVYQGLLQRIADFQRVKAALTKETSMMNGFPEATRRLLRLKDLC